MPRRSRPDGVLGSRTREVGFVDFPSGNAVKSALQTKWAGARENALAPQRRGCEARLKFFKIIPDYASGKSLVRAVPVIPVPLFVLKSAVQTLNMKRLIAILAAIAMATFASAQSSVTGSIFSTTFESDSPDTLFSGSISVPFNFAGLGEAYRPDVWVGGYQLSVTMELSNANASAADPVVEALYKNTTGLTSIPLGSITFNDEGGLTTLSSNPFSFIPDYSGSRVTIKYGSILLDGGESVPFSASYTLTAVPEPSTYALLLGVGTLGLVGWRRFRRK